MSQHAHSPSLFDSALATAALVTIATGGALIGLGVRAGETSRLFRLAGRSLLERIGVSSASAPLTSVAVGYLHHLVVASVWGLLLAIAVLPWRGNARITATLIGTVLYAALSLTLLSPVFRIGLSVTSNVVSVVPIAVAMVAALLGGVWSTSGAPQRG